MKKFPFFNGVREVQAISGALMGYEIAVATIRDIFPDAAAWLSHQQRTALPEALATEGINKDDVRKVFAEIDS